VLLDITLFIISIVVASIFFGYFTIKIQLRISILFSCSSKGELFLYSYMTSHEHVLADSVLVPVDYLSGFVQGVLTGLYVTIIKEMHSY
jgi:hypothetical protein